MKTFLKLSILGAGILTATLPSLVAQTTDNSASSPAPSTAPATPNGPRARAVRRAMFRHHLAKKLGLSADQIAQLKSVRQSTAAAVKAIRSDGSLTADQKKAKIRETRVAARTQMRSVLTPDQLTKLQTLRAKHKAPRA